MNVSHTSSTSRGWTGLLRSLLLFAIATAAGAGLLGVRWAVRGNADPLDVDWPLYLQIGSLALAALIAIFGRRPFAAAFGLFFGLVAYMLIDGQAEYPVASAIAFAVNGLLPALAGALLVFGIQVAIRPKRAKVE
jgi:hypothetical protein